MQVGPVVPQSNILTFSFQPVNPDGDVEWRVHQTSGFSKSVASSVLNPQEPHLQKTHVRATHL